MDDPIATALGSDTAYAARRFVFAKAAWYFYSWMETVRRRACSFLLMANPERVTIRGARTTQTLGRNDYIVDMSKMQSSVHAQEPAARLRYGRRRKRLAR